MRTDLFGPDQLARHARALASSHQVVVGRSTNRLLPRLAENEACLRAFNLSTLAAAPGRRITPAAEWLLDNFYLIEEQVQMTRRHLPRGYYRILPRLGAGPSAGLPRVYDLMLELITHGDAQLEIGQLSACVAAYQTVASLKLGELWAIPIMLRLGLIENLRLISTRLTAARADRDLADRWVDRLQHMAETAPSNLVVVVAQLAASEPPLTSAFVAEFCAQLSRQSPGLKLARDWLEQRLVTAGLALDQLIEQDSQRQAADQVSVSHCIASLRLLSACDWKEFVEGLSLVETILRTDPAEVYRAMDFATRDRYRHAVEFFARHSGQSEAEIARRAIALTTECAQQHGLSHRTAHVGYFLIEKGRATLGRAVRVRWPWRMRREHFIQRFPLAFYAGGIGVVTLLTTLGFFLTVRAAGVSSGRLVFLSLVFLVCASQMAGAVINWCAILWMKPSLLPRMDFSAGIAPECRTMVVVPTLLTSPAAVDRLIETLEIHQLANRDPQVYFALLTDFRDAAAVMLPGDQELLDLAVAGIGRLNRKYPAGDQTRYFLFHRPRRWNASENRWMGAERKRGKLMEFNALLRGGARECFSVIEGRTAVLPTIRYVITLDTDTQLPRDAARQLVGTMAHPLNRPVFDPGSGLVAEGYSILQPRVGVSLPSARRSWFVRLFAGDTGIDPYTREVSDVYQDVFHEGSYIGKGIYEVDAFARALHGRFPENAVLSHDLLEACHARSGLVSDVEFYEEFPSRHNVDVDRRHRWTRGDWQLTPWLLPRVPGPDARRVANPLSGLSQWKIFDNLRRSLVPFALLLLLPGLWLLLPATGGSGTSLVVGLLALPGLLAVLSDLARKPADLHWGAHARTVAGAAGRQFAQLLLSLVFLPYDAFISLDAIGRTLLRLLVTRRRLLEWQTSSEVEKSPRADLAGFYSIMWIAPAVALSTGLLLAILRPTHLAAAVPVLVVWLVAPGIAWWISQPIVPPDPKLSAGQRAFLRQTARRTWHFFATFVTAEDNWLPPDNFQEQPLPATATRTSPTNLGVALLANLAAHDLGYLPTDGLIQRVTDTLTTMQRLERHRGHFLNWYETRTLQPLLPRYVSSVDSGNLAGHLLTLGAGLRELAGKKIFTPVIFSGLRDTAGILLALAPQNPAIAALEGELAQTPLTLGTAHDALMNATAAASALVAAHGGGEGEVALWCRTLQHECEAHLAALRQFAPWLALPAPGASSPLWAALDQTPTLLELSRLDQSPTYVSGLTPATLPTEFTGCLHAAADSARQQLAALESLAQTCDDLAGAMDFTLLFDPARDLFATGYNLTERRHDPGFYDLLASESRLCSYVAIALGQVPQEHWFSLGRRLVASQGEPVLVSWSGSMFEYLMPLLVMPDYEQTLLDHTCRSAVRQQIAYGQIRHVPWGISESGYNRTDAQQNYQYRAFGVPGLGLKRGLADDLVIAPYATALALQVAPVEACANLQRLAAEGRAGTYGFHEAVDYTPARLPPGETSATIRSYMSHHQGMSLLALVNVLCDEPMPRRFLACPVLKAAELLLQERVPRASAAVLSTDLQLEESHPAVSPGEAVLRVYPNPTPPIPEVHLLSNGHYHVVINNAGAGYSRWRGLAITRWREDSACDDRGTFVYLRDLASGEFWSAAHQPTLAAVEGYEAIFSQARAEFRHRRAGLELHTVISVSPEDDVELRRVTITNRSSVVRVLELTSYAEIVLAPPGDDAAHPAFSNLFVQTELLRDSSAVLCMRRPRALEEKPPWLFFQLVGSGAAMEKISCETDRSKFVGRGGTLAQPAALADRTPLSNTVGAVLDPVVALRRMVHLPPHGTAVLDLVCGVAESRDAALALVEKYQGSRMTDRVFDLAWTHGQVTLRQLGISEAEARSYGELARALVYADSTRRAGTAVLLANRRGQSALWSFGISGDVPIVLLHLGNSTNLDLARQLVQAHAYWRIKGLTVELVILTEDAAVYLQPLQEEITRLIASGTEARLLDQPGGIFVRHFEQISPEDRVLLQAAARIVLDDERGSLAEQLEPRVGQPPAVPPLERTRAPVADPPPPLPPRELIFANGLGGFTRDGHEYVITLPPGQMTPAPWVNVLANPAFGTVVSESGSAYTWLENSHEFRLTPWSNDPVSDPAGEALYLRDEQTGEFWSPTPLPARGPAPYVIRHGFGYTVFEHTSHGIVSELWVFVAMDAPVKFSVLKLRNISGRPRRLSATCYVEWVLGDLRAKHLLHVQTEVDSKTGALLARNYHNSDFSGRVAFLDVNDLTRTVTGDRREFLGRNGRRVAPAALLRTRLSGRVGVGLDPCGALQVTFDLPDGQTRETTFRLGAASTATEALYHIRRFRSAEASRLALEGVWDYWNRTLGTVNVDTPDPAVNVMANGWLLYQTLVCRLWGRTGFYQSGGAYGFRDQLQDVMALVHAEPALTRAHLLRAAARQFRAGDVQHWWHPPTGRGVRTHFSDDLLWLPYVTCHYVTCVADTGVLDEVIPFLEGRPLKPESEADYDLPNRALETGTLYEHCVRAIDHSLKYGAHGLPLMGCGDWNDGMNLVAKAGRGESVWLGFFLYAVLIPFTRLARTRQDIARADRYFTHARLLQSHLEENAWDGSWYRRAYFDNGDPLGSVTNQECQIDSLPQSWAVISGAGDPARARQALEAVDARLVHRDTGLVQLFDPPFDHSPLNPGYIKGYIPGVRENGGQYTQAAIWVAMAFALRGDATRAWELLAQLNPIHHSSTPAQIATYKVEPYVVAADVYAVAPHTGRGGWTWYTGSAGWMYQLITETLLGLHLEGDRLRLEPRLPPTWNTCKIHYRYRQTIYHLTLFRLAAGAAEVGGLTLDGQALPDTTLPLRDDRQEHFAELKVRSDQP